ncbi:DNA polymerase III delta prime subunit [Shimia isoporae]|uniref:DNA polymerase III delta prime subunit n=1 Tax=Shimia isoporae TaxID=647720 RepID=A0A4V2Q3R9_9RHOB|nr:DNA polymerase III subunit delta' [Shimia isoporae]TCL08250.1 DNA polymerase III delta prime subunit [Shimia isoporae]
MSDETTPEPDRVPGAPHPRETDQLFGQSQAEMNFLTAVNSGRLHHGWLLTGPQGVGKATMAWRIARFLLTQPVEDGGGLFGEPQPHDSLSIDPDHPVAHRIIALSEPGLFLLRRGFAGSTDSAREKSRQEGKFAADIRVNEVREMASFLHMSATDGGRRVVIVDSADEMNVNAANALLKMLEEPPDRTTMLLISHQPSRLLPTIRSRCRELRFHPLSPEDMHAAMEQAGHAADETPALAELSAGSVGEALRITQLGGLSIYQELAALFASMPQFDRQRALKLAEGAAARGADAHFDLLLTLLDVFVSRIARTGALGTPPVTEIVQGEAELLMRLSPDAHKARAWANLAQEITDRTRHGKAVNLDPAALVLDTVFKIQKTASA